MFLPPTLDAVSVICLLLLGMISLRLYRNGVSAALHAASLVALSLVSIGVSIVYATVTHFMSDPHTLSEAIAALSGRPPQLVLSLIGVPLFVLACLGPWQALTGNWHGALSRGRLYCVHWVVVIGWLAIALLEPTNVFALQPNLSERSPEEATSQIDQFRRARDIYRFLILGYAALVAAIFLAPFVQWATHRSLQ
ncbi:hypothetical protein [uncultured Tateyamaria sp.]|uniref:hypothetical protein n=1 Tax=uncultured Tateyamaria sp. TaxID=455651 RepID=UPI002617AD96|nr:hypothetical protein [uncultured Tateyamaria sp.]